MTGESEPQKRPKAVMLLSGGLDSQLAARMVAEQGVEVKAITFLTNFGCGTGEGGACGHTPKEDGIEELPYTVKLCHLGQEYVDMVAHPVFGYGKNMNPCMDCRAMMLKNAWEYAQAVGADFLITGEVLGQRPKSQRKAAMEIVEEAIGLKGKILRPLSAQLLPATEAERKGWVDRGKLGAIRGRSRQEQLCMAKDMGLEDFPNPAGGCMLTDPGYAARFRDMVSYTPCPDQSDVEVIKYGRIFRLGPRTRAYVGRDHHDNVMLLGLLRPGDRVLQLAEYNGPVSLVRGPASDEDLRLVAEITARYGQAPQVEGAVCTLCEAGPDGTLPEPDAAQPASPAVRRLTCVTHPAQERLESMMVGRDAPKAGGSE